jgi:hypothetical protein
VFEGFQFLSSFGLFSRNTSFKSLLWRFHRYVAMSTMSERAAGLPGKMMRFERRRDQRTGFGYNVFKGLLD